MSKLTALQGKSQVFKIGEVELELKPLTVDELELFSIDDKAPIEKQMEGTKRMISTILKKSIPDATEDEIKNISLEHLKEFMDAVMKLHKLEGDSTAQKLKDAIKNRQNPSKNIGQG